MVWRAMIVQEVEKKSKSWRFGPKKEHKSVAHDVADPCWWSKTASENVFDFLFLCFSPCEGIQDSLGFWISRRGFWIPSILDSSLSYWNFFVNFFYYLISFVIGTWMLDSNRKWESGFLELVFRSPVTRKTVKFNPGVSQILSKVFLSKNMSLELTTYCCVFPPRSSDDYVECYSKQCMGR